jgi:alpha-tubulin suppressor-like RCC1 family protein
MKCDHLLVEASVLCDQICSLRHVINCNILNFLDIGQVWGWGYGGEGQLGLGSRIRMVSSPHLIPCIDSSSYSKDISASLSQGSMSSEGQNFRIPGSCIKAIACGGRHSAVITGVLVFLVSQINIF